MIDGRMGYLLIGALSLVLLGLVGCEECPDRAPPCLDESFYDLYPTTTTESPAGAAMVTAVGRDAVRVSMLDSGDGGVFRSLPAIPALEAGDEVMIEGGVGGSYLVSRDGEPVFYTGRSSFVAPSAVDSVAGVDAELVEACREPSVDGQCFFGTTVYALIVGEERIEPGATTTVTLPDGRMATIRNRLINRGTSSCRECLDLPPSNLMVDIVFH